VIRLPPRRTALLASLVAGGIALVFPVGAAPADAVVLKARLTAKYLGTSSRGSGTAKITITAARVCWQLSFRGLDKTGDSGIRVAPPPAAGTRKRSVFPLTTNTSTKPGCVPVSRWGPSSAGWAAKIAANPSAFYVSIATAKYRNGAIGGRLTR